MATDKTYPCGCNPLTKEDVANLIHEEEAASKEEGWKLLNKDDDHEIWRKDDHLNPAHLVKAFLKFKDIPSEAITDIIYDLESRPKWDKHFPVIEILETSKHCRKVYWLCKMPVGVSDRDTIQRICTHYDEKTKTTFVKSYHATHPSKPEVSGVVRTETILSGIIIRPHPDDPKSTRVTVLIQVDMKGLIPHPIANAFLSKSPAEWQNSLAKYYWNDYSKKGQQGEGKE